MTKCFVCESSDQFKIPYINKHVEESTIQWSKYHINVCNACGFGAIDPQVSPDLLDKFYHVDNSDSSNSYNPSFFNHSVKEISQPLSLSLFFESQNIDKIKFLDYGCGTYGYAFNAFSKIFGPDKVECSGIDPNVLTRKILVKNGVEYLGEDYHVLENQENKFDIILMSHVLEHFNQEDAVNCLNTLHDSLEQNGFLMIDVPHDDFRSKEKSNLSSAPHTMFFTPDSLKILLESCNYQVLYCRVFGPNVGNYEQLYLDNVLHPNKIKSLLQGIKSLVPISWKEYLKNLLKKNNPDIFLRDLISTNSRGVFLRAIVTKK